VQHIPRILTRQRTLSCIVRNLDVECFQQKHVYRL
jgi:hypothetical protein